MNTATGVATNLAGASDGWYVAGACIGSVLLSGTKIAPLVLAFLGVAIIYQLNGILSPTSASKTPVSTKGQSAI